MIEFHIGNSHTLEARMVAESIFRFEMTYLKKRYGKVPKAFTGEDSLEGTVYKYWIFPDEELWVICDSYDELEELGL